MPSPLTAQAVFSCEKIDLKGKQIKYPSFLQAYFRRNYAEKLATPLDLLH
jgi:hypothetical protein